jgi:hypothetical protein
MDAGSTFASMIGMTVRRLTSGVTSAVTPHAWVYACGSDEIWEDIRDDLIADIKDAAESHPCNRRLQTKVSIGKVRANL